MADNFDYIKCTQIELIKHLGEIKITEEFIKEILETYNVLYMDYQKEILKINEKRVEILDKVRHVQKVYKNSLGHGDIKPIDDEVVADNQDVVEPEKEKRGRKKTK